MSMALQAFQYKRKLNKTLKDVKSNAPFMGKSKRSAKQESSSWMSSITGKKPDDVTKQAETKPQDSQQKSFLPWHKQNVEAEGQEQASPGDEQPETFEVAAAKDDDTKSKKNDNDGISNRKKSPKCKTLFKRRNRHVVDNGDETNKEPPSSPSKDTGNKDETKSTSKKKEKKNDDDDDDWWMDDNDNESENDAYSESSHHKKVTSDDDEQPEYNPRAEAEYTKSSRGDSSWWE
jgi:hypothetical protein